MNISIRGLRVMDRRSIIGTWNSFRYGATVSLSVLVCDTCAAWKKGEKGNGDSYAMLMLLVIFMFD